MIQNFFCVFVLLYTINRSGLKNYFLLFIVYFFIFSDLYSQNYKQMLDHNSEWQLTVCNNGCITDIYFTDGDTSYNNYSYKILNGYHYISRTFWLRENTQTEKVYLSFLQNNNRKEVLLYDFDLQKGDSIEINNPISPFIANPGYYIVDSIANIQLIDGLFYDHFYLSSLSLLVIESAVWIEGIGSLSLINAPGGTPDVNGSGKLSCYFNDGNLVYSQLDSISQCVFANPNLSNNFIYHKPDRFVIFYTDLFGRKVDIIRNVPIFIHYNDATVEKRIYLD